jgi:hypothetical protein
VRVYQFRHTGMRRHLYPKAGAPGKKKISGHGGACFRLKDRSIAANRDGCDGAAARL